MAENVQSKNNYRVLVSRLNELEKGKPHKDGDKAKIGGHAFFFYKGRFQLLMDIVKESGTEVNEHTVKSRINRGWSLEKALTTAVDERKSRGMTQYHKKTDATEKINGCIHYQGDFHNCFTCPYADCIESGKMRGDPNVNKLHLHLNGGYTDDDDPFCRPKKVTASLGSFGDYGNFIW